MFSAGFRKDQLPHWLGFGKDFSQYTVFVTTKSSVDPIYFSDPN